MIDYWLLYGVSLLALTFHRLGNLVGIGIGLGIGHGRWQQLTSRLRLFTFRPLPVFNSISQHLPTSASLMAKGNTNVPLPKLNGDSDWNGQTDKAEERQLRQHVGYQGNM